MQCSLNFSNEEKKELLQVLKKFPKIKTNTAFEEARFRIGESTATLYSSGKLLLQGKDCEKAREKILQNVRFSQEAILGIDETGRGESFGPFVIAAVMGKPNELRELRDSKKIKDIHGKRKLVEKNALAISVFSVSSKELSLLHEKGINLNQIEARAINCWLDFFREIDKNLKIVVDGNPLRNCRKTVSFLPKGDDLNPVVGAASVVAKSFREKSGDRGKRAGWGSWQKKGR